MNINTLPLMSKGPIAIFGPLVPAFGSSHITIQMPGFMSFAPQAWNGGALRKLS
jgi:hypothetical protein